MSNSPLISYTKISPNKTSPRTHIIDTITIHCVVGQLSVETMGEMFARASYEASCNYAIGTDGRIALIVDEGDRSWCSSNRDNDHRAITIECACDLTSPYAVNDKVYAALIDLLVDVCQRNGIEQLLWKADKSLIGHPAEQNMTVHRWFANKACPGEYLYNLHGTIASEVNSRLDAAKEDPETDKIWMGWTKRESGTNGFKTVNGDSGRAYGKYQFDYRYALVPFLRNCLDYDADHYAGFRTFIGYGAGSDKLVGNSFLAEQWTYACENWPAEFEALQDRYAYKAYYQEAAKYIKNLYGIVMDHHSAALKGTLWSMAIRSGALNAAKRFDGCTDETSDAEMMRVAYGTYGSEDAGRWTKAGQYGDAIDALSSGGYTDITVTGSLPDDVGDILPVTDEEWLRVGTTWVSGKCKNQAGAFHDLEKAKKLADDTCAEKKKSYYVFDSDGNVQYTAEYKSSQYTVQAGSFTESANADNLAGQIQAAGFDVIVKGEDGQYKVQCGVFDEKENAEALKKKLLAAGFDAVIK